MNSEVVSPHYKLPLTHPFRRNCLLLMVNMSQNNMKRRAIVLDHGRCHIGWRHGNGGRWLIERIYRRWRLSRYGTKVYSLLGRSVADIAFLGKWMWDVEQPPVLHDWCNKGRGMCYPVYGMVHIKEPLLLIGKSSPCGGSGFPLSLSEWSFTIGPTPYNRK